MCVCVQYQGLQRLFLFFLFHLLYTSSLTPSSFAFSLLQLYFMKFLLSIHFTYFLPYFYFPLLHSNKRAMFSIALLFSYLAGVPFSCIYSGNFPCLAIGVWSARILPPQITLCSYCNIIIAFLFFLVYVFPYNFFISYHLIISLIFYLPQC